MTGDDDDLDHGGPSREPIAELLDQVLASDDQGLRDGQQAGPGAVGRPGLDPGSAHGACSAAS